MMDVSSVGAAGSAGAVDEVEPDEVDEAQAPVAELTPVGLSGFDGPKPNLVSLNPQADQLSVDRSGDLDSMGTNRKSKVTGTNDDSIGDGSVSVERDPDDFGTLGVAGSVDVEAATAGLSDEAKAQVTTLLSDPTTASDAKYAFSSPTYAKLDADQREKFVDIMAHTGTDGVSMLAHGCEVSGDLSSLRATDGSTVLDNLDRMVKTPGLAPYVAGVAADMILPDRIKQGRAPTCTAATMQYELASKNPAEYSRLIAGLAIDGSVTMAGGDTLTTQPGVALNGSIAAKDGRNPSEAVFQGAVMEYANGKDETYNLDTMESTGNGRTHLGLNGDQIQAGVSQLFGVRYKTTDIHNDDEARAALSTLNRSLTPNRPVLVDISVSPTNNHCMAFEGYSNGQVQLRDPETGKRSSMSEYQFIETVAGVHVAPVPVKSINDPIDGHGRIFIE